MRCKPGDLAILIRSEFAENVGQLVEVVEMREFGVWLVRGLRPGRARLMETREVIYCCEEEGLVEDERLMPLPGVGRMGGKARRGRKTPEGVCG